MKVNFDMRQVIAKANNLAAFRDAVATLKERLTPFHEGVEEFEAPEEIRHYRLKFPPWICQPYVRPPPEEHLRKVNEIREREKAANLGCEAFATFTQNHEDVAEIKFYFVSV